MSIEAILIGCITGFVSAFFGIGGSSIDTPLLRIFLHLPPYIALGTPLPTAFVAVFIALVTYWKSHSVNFRVFKYSILGGLPGIILGSYFSNFFPGKTLMILTAIVLFVIGIDFLIKSIRDMQNEELGNHEERMKSVHRGYIFAVSFFVSIVSGILAIGGGLLLIPAYIMLFGMKMKEAISTSLLTVAIIILPSCIVHYQLGHISLGTSMAMGLGVIPMAYIGAKTDLRTKSKTVQILFGIMLIIFSVYFFISQMK